MAGLIREEDIALVRERARIDEIVSSYVTLRNAGGGSQKGLCPFHDEKSPSFHVTPSRGYYHCFGCGEGGDVISFVQKIEGTSFSETVERLADKVGIQLRYTEGDARPQKRESHLRPRMLEAHKAAAAFYVDQLATPDALAGRTFLSERGFDRDAAETFGVGFAPRGGDVLYKHLRQKGFKDEELVTGGLVAMGRSGHYDRFRGRLLWPIRETNGDVIGFGARRLFDDDRIEAKYLNTPETPLYKKSHVLYGIDLARRDIARTSQAVVVEGYTDVMACHLAGVPTAVATCGTAFGEDHARVVRRLLNDHEEFRGEVIFTFDGDEAGQRAALKAFKGDQQFVAQTYVAVEPDGLDPCDLRLQKGDASVRELVARRIPLYRFVLKNVVGQYDLDRADARAAAVREAAALVSSSRDTAVKNSSFAREIANLTGVDPDDVVVEVRRVAGRAGRADDRRTPSAAGQAQPPPERPAAPPRPDLRDPRFSLERETLKLVVQHPTAVGRTARDVGAEDFTHPTYRAVWEAVTACGGPAGAPAGEVWVSKLRDNLRDEQAVPALSALAVEPVLSAKDPDHAYVSAHVFRLLELTALRRIADLKSKLQRTNPVEQAADYNRMFGELVALEQHRRTLREKAIGGAE
ncbi:MAG: DNA primase [Nocardioidaceae bacterium]